MQARRDPLAIFYTPTQTIPQRPVERQLKRAPGEEEEGGRSSRDLVCEHLG